MKKLITKIQKDISKFQDTIHKEGNDFLAKIKKIDFKSNIDETKKELIKVLTAKLEKMEPTYNNFLNEVRKNAKKAGIDIDKLEKNIKTKAKKVQDKFPSMKKKTKAKAKTANKSTGVKKGRKKASDSVK